MDELADTATITKRSVHSILALISRQFLLRTLSFVSSLVIFTYLAPRDIGVYFAVIAMQRIISFFTDFGIGAALIQKKEQIKQTEIKTFFTLQAGLTFGIFCIFFLASDSITSFFRLTEPAIQLLLVLVFTIFLSSFKMIPSNLLERSIKFQKLIVPQIIESLVFNILLITLVLKEQGLNSYSWAFLISGLISIPFYYIVSPWKIEFGIDKKAFRHLKYGLTFQAKNILATVKDDALTVFLTKIITYAEISYIGFAQNFAFYVFRYIVDSVTKVTFSTFARIQDNAAHMQKAIERSLFFVSAIMFPVLIGIVITGPYIISFIPKWQNKWEPAVVSLVFFCLNAGVSSLSNILVNVLDATGRVKTTLRLMVIWTALIWILTPILIYIIGYNGVSIASFLVTLTIFYTVYLVKQIADFRLMKSIYKPFFASITMGIIVYTGARVLTVDFLTLFVMILSGIIIYTAVMYIFAWKELREDVKFVFRAL